MDLANEVSKVAKRVSLSHHQDPEPQTVFATNVDKRPDVERLTSNGAVFVDGTEQTYTVILYCTGFKYTFPFLSIDCGISVDDNYVAPLYKHCININHPTMALIGVPYYVCASQMFDLQVNLFSLINILFMVILYSLCICTLLSMNSARKPIPSASCYIYSECNIDLQNRQFTKLQIVLIYLIGSFHHEIFFQAKGIAIKSGYAQRYQ